MSVRGRPAAGLLVTARSDVGRAAARLHAFLQRHGVRRLNVAGLRASEAVKLPVFVRTVLERARASLSALSAHLRGRSRAVGA